MTAGAHSAAPLTGDTIRVWDLPLRLFHWLLVATIAVAFLSAIEGSPLAPWHQTAGWVAAILVVFRLVWGVVGGEHARLSRLFRPGELGRHLSQLAGGRAEPSLGHNPLGALAIIGLLTLVAGAVFTGASMGGGEEDLHEAVAYALLGLIALHVGAVLVMSWAGRESLVAAMITGRKRTARHPGAKDAQRASPLALAIAAVAVAASAYGVTRIDPGAFRPHASEAGDAREAGEAGDRD